MKQKVLFYLYLTVLMLPNLILCFTENMPWYGKATLLLLPLSVYWTVMTLSHRPSKICLWLFPIQFLGAFNIVLSYLFGKGVIAVDMWLNVATSSPNEAGEMLAQLYPSVVAVVVIYIPTLICAIYDTRKKGRLSNLFIRRQRWVAGTLLLASIPLTGATLATGKWNILDDLFPVNVCYNLKLAVQRQAISLKYLENSRDFRFEATCQDADTIPQVLVLVIGETSRAANWQIMGYERETNPQLSKTPGIIAYHDCLTQSNATHKSVPIILSHATAEDFPVLYHSKGLLAAFREAGYHTTFVSNEPRNHSFNDHLAEQADTAIFLRDKISGDPKDTLLLPYVSEALALDRKYPHQLIVLHSYGSHSTYSDRYEDYQSHFHPDNVVKATAGCRDILINAYDNTIRLTDHFLARIIDMLNQSGRPSALVYTSDHGEDIYDDERNLYLHASPWPSYYQLHTPLVFWFSQGYRQLYPQRTNLVAEHRKDPVQSDCIFPTMLTLGGIHTKINQDTLSLASPDYRIKAQRHYLTDHNQSVTLDRCLEPQDFVQLRKRNLRPY